MYRLADAPQLRPRMFRHDGQSCVNRIFLRVLLDEALALPDDERSAVAVALLDSLESADPSAVSEAWRDEIKRRRDELRSGKVRAIPWTEVKQRYRSL